jgi:hypothetical protein
MSVRLACLTASAYWRSVGPCFAVYKELPLGYRVIYTVVAGVPTTLITGLICLYEMLNDLADTPRCLIWGVPPPVSEEEYTKTTQMIDRALPRLTALIEALQEHRKERFRSLR